MTSLDDVFNSPFVSLPLVAMFQQSVRSDAATFGVLFVFLLDMLVAIPGAWITASRMLWTLGEPLDMVTTVMIADSLLQAATMPLPFRATSAPSRPTIAIPSTPKSYAPALAPCSG